MPKEEKMLDMGDNKFKRTDEIKRVIFNSSLPYLPCINRISFSFIINHSRDDSISIILLPVIDNM